jgi:SOS-response transcriptional repressor LexA
MGQDDAAGEGFDQANKLFIAGRGFDDGFELSQLFEEPSDGCFVGASESLTSDDLSSWVHDADGDSLFVQVAAGVKHGVLLVVETETQQFTFTTFSKHTPAGSACS